MPKVIINGFDHLNGEYPFDLDFTFRDFRTIKKISGLRASEVMEAIEAGDTDVLVALASIALRKAQKDHSEDMLLDMSALGGALTFDFTDVDAEDIEETPPPAVEETKTGSFDGDSGTGSKDATTSFPVISSPDGSGIPQRDSSSGPVTSTT